MPIYTIQLRINVPALGERIVDFPGTVAPTIEAAITAAKTSVIIEAIGALKTA